MTWPVPGTLTESELPLFPLSSIVLPGGRLALRIFEPRYTRMVAQCLRDDGRFGVCLLRRGREAGGPGEPFGVGVAVRIVDFDRLADGFLGIVAEGERRFRCVRRWQQPDGLWLGRVHWLAPDADCAVPPQLEPLADLLGQCYEQLADPPSEPWRMKDAAWLSGRLLEILPLEPVLRQELLELDDPIARLLRLAGMLREPQQN